MGGVRVNACCGQRTWRMSCIVGVGIVGGQFLIPPPFFFVNTGVLSSLFLKK
eukprot:NODE_11014_length_270_cov_15.615385_g9244_i0.p3 GENE.NODE_11014_length_270_cov_15.615385_g9244_i0~~NODE_11014_length_270_cov_15.615385_g9244_i0.p3  ORF type:complete len:60 (+),score=9.98 NODE_11014_length_270_cov_15.615385_g9244_i0:27-182(+)